MVVFIHCNLNGAHGCSCCALLLAVGPFDRHPCLAPHHITACDCSVSGRSVRGARRAPLTQEELACDFDPKGRFA